jgi:hypothetical protein
VEYKLLIVKLPQLDLLELPQVLILMDYLLLQTLKVVTLLHFMM